MLARFVLSSGQNEELEITSAVNDEYLFPAKASISQLWPLKL